MPVAKNPDGTPDHGPGVWARFANAGGINTQSLPGGVGRLPASVDNADAHRIPGDVGDPAGVKRGVVQGVPSAQWAFADCRTVAFPGTPDRRASA